MTASINVFAWDESRGIELRICLVSAFPPSTQRLNEYGFHLASEVQHHAELIVLGDKHNEGAEDDQFDVDRCWSFNSVKTPFSILNAVKRVKPDLVWFNLVYSSFGDGALPAFAGLCTPALLRAHGFGTHVTLHHLMENVDLADADVRFGRLYQLGGAVATRMLLLSNSVSVLLPSYKEKLNKKYGWGKVVVHPHGILGNLFKPTHSIDRELRILAFGKWGRYKRLEDMIDAFELVSQDLPGARLIIAGPDHPNRPGYVASLQQQYSSNSSIKFLGYIPENELCRVFSSADVVVLPYSSSGGPSGVAHQACQYSLPIIAAGIEDLRTLTNEAQLAVEFYEPGNVNDLATKLRILAADPGKRQAMAAMNAAVAERMLIRNVVRDYVSHFEELLGVGRSTEAISEVAA